MTQIDTLVEALGEAAYATTRDDWRIAINRLRVAVANRTSYYRPLGRALFLDHLEAKRLLDFAARIGEQVHAGKLKEDRARRRLLQRAMINCEPDLPARFPFVVEPVIDASGRGRFRIVGPKHADGSFLINYSFWKAASAWRPVARWRTFLLRKCPVCGKSYRDGRIVMRGGLLSRCRECLNGDRRLKR